MERRRRIYLHPILGHPHQVPREEPGAPAIVQEIAGPGHRGHREQAAALLLEGPGQRGERDGLRGARRQVDPQEILRHLAPRPRRGDLLLVLVVKVLAPLLLRDGGQLRVPIDPRRLAVAVGPRGLLLRRVGAQRHQHRILRIQRGPVAVLVDAHEAPRLHLVPGVAAAPGGDGLPGLQLRMTPQPQEPQPPARQRRLVVHPHKPCLRVNTGHLTPLSLTGSGGRRHTAGGRCSTAGAGRGRGGGASGASSAQRGGARRGVGGTGAGGASRAGAGGVQGPRGAGGGQRRGLSSQAIRGAGRLRLVTGEPAEDPPNEQRTNEPGSHRPGLQRRSAAGKNPGSLQGGAGEGPGCPG